MKKTLRYLAFLFGSMLTCQGLLAQTAVPVISYAGSPYTFNVSTSVGTVMPTVGGSAVAPGYTSVSLLSTITTTNNHPACITTDAAGNSYILITKANGTPIVKLYKVTTGGTLSTMTVSNSAALSAPDGIVLDAGGNLYISDVNNGKVYKYTLSPAGATTTATLSATIGTNALGNIYAPAGLAVDATNLYVADAQGAGTTGGVVFKIPLTTLAVGTAYITGLNNPVGIALDASSSVYVTQPTANNIIKTTTGGVKTTITGAFSNPQYLSSDGLGDIWVADFGNNAVKEISAAGVVSSMITTGLSSPAQVSFDGLTPKNLYEADFTTQTINKSTPSTYYTISSPLPAGLNFDPTTGYITGSPTATLATTNYVVTGYNTAGNSGTTVTNLTITVKVQKPIISYSTPDTYTYGATVTLNPGNSGGAPLSYAAPTLPAGLSINTTTGVISGPLTAISAAANYNVTATNTGGTSAAFPINITVNPAPLTITATGPIKPYGTAIPTGSSTTNFTTSALVNGNTITSVTLTPDANGASATTPVGSPYVVTPSAPVGGGGFSASNYSITYVPYNGTVAKPNLTITATDVSKVYGTALTGGAGSTAFTSSGLQGGDMIGSVTIAYGTGAAATDGVGTDASQIIASAATGGTFNPANYNITYVNGTITVTTAPLTITATGPAKTYGQALTSGTSATNFIPTGLVNGNTITSVTLTPAGTGAPANGPAASTYTITPSSPVGSGGFSAANYSITYVPYNGTVTPATLTVTATGPLKPYGTAIPTGTSTTNFTYSATAVSGETVTSVTLTPDANGASATTPVGSPYVVTPSAATGGGGFTASNYNITYVPYNGTVAKPNLTITATDVSKVYGTAITGGAGSTAFTATGLQGGETVGSVTIAYGTGAAATDGVASDANQVIVSAATGGTFTPGNYNIIYVNGTINVTPAPLTITATGPAKIYGQALTTGTSTTNFSSLGLLNGNTLTSVTLTPAGTGITAGAAAGTTYTVTPSNPNGGNGYSSSNYSITYVAYNGTVTPAPLTIAATGPTKTYGQAIATGSSTTNFTPTGLVNSNTVISVTLTPDAAGASATTLAGAAYVITPSAPAGGGGFAASNYNITYTPYNGTVTTAALTITANLVNKTYGTLLSGGTGSTAFTPTGLQNSETIGSVTIAYGTGAAANAAVGTYTAAVTPSAATGGSFNPANYTITYAKNSIVIAQALLTITANNVSKTYGTAITGASGSTAFTTSGLQNSETIGSITVAYGTGAAANAAAGTYTTNTPSAATGGTFTASNYAITYTKGNIIVNPAPLTIASTDVTKPYGTTLTNGAGSTGFTPTGLVLGQTVGSVTVAYGTGAAAGAAVGTYANAVTPSAATGGTFTASNYTITYQATGNIIVTQAALTITANDQTITIGSPIPALTLTYTGLVNGDTPSSFSPQPVGTTTANNSSPIGTYPINITPGTNNNYSITYVSGTLYINDIKPNISYTPSTNNYLVGTMIASLTPVNIGGAIPTSGFGKGVALTGTTFSGPQGMAFDAAGNLYITENGGRASVFNTSNTFTGNYGQALTRPEGIAFDLSGYGYIVDFSNANVYQYTAGGVAQGAVLTAGTLNKPDAIAVDGSGDLYAANFGSNSITKFNGGTGFLLATITTNVNKPVGIVTDASGNVYVLNQGSKTVTKYNANGNYVSTVVTGLNNPTALGIDNNGNFYVGDSGTATVTEYNGSGTVLTTVPGIGNPAGIVVDDAGDMYVSDNTANTVTMYPPAAGYTINRALPPGILFDSTTGTFSGNPTTAFPTTTFTVTGYNSGGSSSTPVTITCTIKPPNISYTPQTNVYPVNQPIASLSPVNTGAPVTAFGFGTGVAFTGGTLRGPSGIGIDASGNVYVTNFINNTVGKYSSSGAYIGLYGNGGPAYVSPVGIVFDSAGNGYVLNTNNGKVYKYNAAGNYQSTFITGLSHPLGIAIDAAGNFYIADEGTNTLYKYGPTGGTAILTLPSATGANAVDVNVDAAGNIYVLNRSAGTVTKYNSAGVSQGDIITGLTLPFSIHIDANGYVYIGDSDNNNVVVYTSTGTPVTTFAVKDPEGINIDASGNLYVSDYTDNIVYKYPQHGSYTISPGLPAGLSFNTSTGAITGTPTAASPVTTYTVTAYGYGASATTTVIISCVIDYDWVGLTNNDWNTASNWESKTVPGAANLAYVGVHFDFNYIPAISSGTTVNVGGITFGTQASQADQLIVNGGGTLNAGPIIYQSDSKSNQPYICTISGGGTLNTPSITVIANTTLTGQPYTEAFASSLSNLNVTGNILLTSTFVGSDAFGSSFTVTGGITKLTGILQTTNTSGSKSTLGVTGGTLQLVNTTALSGLSSNGTNIVSFVNPGATVEYAGAAQTVYNDAAITGLSSGVSYQNIKFSGTGVKTVAAGNLNITGNFTNTMVNDASNYVKLTAPAVNFNGTTQSLAGGNGNGTIFTTVNFSGAGTKTMASGIFSVSSSGILTMSGTNTSTILNAGGFLTLNSDATGCATVAGISNTAANTATPNGPSITGNVKVQRFVTGGTNSNNSYRGYRLLTSPVYTSSANSNNIYSLNYLTNSIYTTGTDGTSGGFDKSGNPTLYLYRENLPPSNTTFISGNFRGIKNIASSPSYLIDSDPGNFNIPVGNGYLCFYRGNRKAALLGTETVVGYVPTSDTLAVTGVLNQGNVTVADWYTPTSLNLGYTLTAGNDAVRGFNLVGNPYASSIDWNKFSSSSNSAPIYGPGLAGGAIWVYKSTSRNYGTYLPGVGGTNGATSIIPSGQGFFVQAASSPAALTFTESAKVNAQVSGAALFLVSTPKPGLLKTLGVDNSTDYHVRLKLALDSLDTDDILIKFNSGTSPKYNPVEDAEYKTGSGVLSLSSLSSDNVSLAINQLPFPAVSQTIPLKVSATGTGIYSLNMFDITNIPAEYDIWLMDYYKKDSLDIKNNPNYNFNVDQTDTNSFGSHRFALVFRVNASQAYRLLTFTGGRKFQGAELDWTTANEGTNTNFIVERSVDNGKTFQMLGSLISTGVGAYTMMDKQPVPGTDIYRLKQTDALGNVTYSNTVIIAYPTNISTVNIGGSALTTISVYPNPATTTVNIAVLQSFANVTNAEPGVYTITLTNSSGFVVKTANSAEALWEGNIANLLPGTYVITVQKTADKSFVGQAKFVKL